MHSCSIFRRLNRCLASDFTWLIAIILIAFWIPYSLAQAQGVKPETVAASLQNPWALAFLLDGKFLVTERPGRLRVVEPDGRLGKPVAGLPNVAAGGQGGLLDVLLDSDFANNRTLYFFFQSPVRVAPTPRPWRAPRLAATPHGWRT